MTLELALITPLLILILGLISVGGKILTAKGQVQGAARDAARAASLSRVNPQDDATAAAKQTLDGKLKCANANLVKLNPPGGADPGFPVTATVTCVVDVSNLGLPGFPGQKRVIVSVVSPVDSYVGR